MKMNTETFTADIIHFTYTATHHTILSQTQMQTTKFHCYFKAEIDQQKVAYNIGHGK